jgi:hypothetical protein
MARAYIKDYLENPQGNPAREVSQGTAQGAQEYLILLTLQTIYPGAAFPLPSKSLAVFDLPFNPLLVIPTWLRSRSSRVLWA